MRERDDNSHERNQTPRKCAGCSKEIIAGRGKFIFNPTTREIKFFHAGRCFLMAGAYPGGPSTWGEINSLISHMSAHDWMTESDAAEVVLWREWRDASEVGFGLFVLLPVLGILAGLGLLGAVLCRIGSRQSGSW
jgi:hypothetical protein